jgi:hypothetical protein
MFAAGMLETLKINSITTVTILYEKIIPFFADIPSSIVKEKIWRYARKPVRTIRLDWQPGYHSHSVTVDPMALRPQLSLSLPFSVNVILL